MARHFAWAMAAVLLIPASGWAGGQLPSAPQHRPGPGEHHDDQRPELKKWWIDPQLRAELGITDQQSAAVDQVWQKTLPELRDGHERLDKLEKVLSQMVHDGADDPAVEAQIYKVEDTRADLNKVRTVMIYRMNKVLTPDQRAKVKAMNDARNGPSHRGGSTVR
jgi:Spy/CpxP family protein refolding chaperone